MGKKSKSKKKTNYNNGGNHIKYRDGNFLAAKKADDRGLYRKSAELYLKSYRMAVSAYHQPRRSNSRRYNSNYHYWYESFTGYTCLLLEAVQEKKYTHVEEDIKALEKIVDSVYEPSVVRANAALYASHLYHQSVNPNLQLAAELCRQAIAICDSATTEEKNLVIADADGSLRNVGEIITEELKHQTTDFLTAITQNPALMNGFCPETVEKYRDRLTAGGECCDTCGKTRKELGIHHMDCCKRCGMQYYCSIDCQRKSWKSGHKKACRKIGQIEVGDIMKIHGLVDQSCLDGLLVKILGPVGSNSGSVANASSDGRWKVKLLDFPKCLSVAADKLVHIRPAA